MEIRLPTVPPAGPFLHVALQIEDLAVRHTPLVTPTRIGLVKERHVIRRRRRLRGHRPHAIQEFIQVLHRVRFQVPGPLIEQVLIVRLPSLVVVADPGPIVLAIRIGEIGRPGACLGPFVIEAEPLSPMGTSTRSLIKRKHDEWKRAGTIGRLIPIHAKIGTHLGHPGRTRV